MESNIQQIKQRILESIDLKQKIVQDTDILQTVYAIASAITAALQQDKKVLFCGNGGSAADAQHLAAELTGKFKIDREPLFAEALHVNTSYITAVANDYSYDEIYSRLVKAKGREGDVLIGISTSGNSKNIINALETANRLNMLTIGFAGSKGGLMDSVCNYTINVPSNETPRIQEAHILLGHIMCEIIEHNIFGN